MDSNSNKPAVQLRDYQREAADALMVSIKRGERPVVALPTGAGKSLVLAEIARRAAAINKRTLIIAPAAELVQQDRNAIASLCDAHTTVCCAMLGERDTTGHIVLGTPGSLISVDLGRIDLVLIDEAHRLGPDADNQIAKIIAKLRDTNHALRLGGVTATPFRGADGGRLADGPHFNKLVYVKPYVELVRVGHLVRLIAPREALQASYDARNVRIERGDYVTNELADAFDRQDLNDLVATDIVWHGRKRHSWLVFAINIAHAQNLLAALVRRGIDARLVTGQTPAEERAKAFADFKARRIRCLVGCDVFTTGFDAPCVDMIAVCRPTRSPVLHVQILGRGTRPYPGKTGCLILDFAGNFDRVGPFDDPQVLVRRDGGGASLTRSCPACEAIIAISSRACPVCGEALIREEEEQGELNIAARAAHNPQILADDRPPPVRVRDLKAHVHRKAGANESLRIRYFLADGGVVDDWIVAWHLKPWVRARARQKWTMRWPHTAVPHTAADAAYLINKNPDVFAPPFVRVRRVPGDLPIVTHVKVRGGNAA